MLGLPQADLDAVGHALPCQPHAAEQERQLRGVDLARRGIVGHGAKLLAFLDLYCADMPAPLVQAVRALWIEFNARPAAPLAAWPCWASLKSQCW